VGLRDFPGEGMGGVLWSGVKLSSAKAWSCWTSSFLASTLFSFPGSSSNSESSSDSPVSDVPESSLGLSGSGSGVEYSISSEGSGVSDPYSDRSASCSGNSSSASAKDSPTLPFFLTDPLIFYVVVFFLLGLGTVAIRKRPKFEPYITTHSSKPISSSKGTCNSLKILVNNIA